MPKPPNSPRSGGQPNKRVIVLGIVLACVFVVWLVTMVTGIGLGR